VAAGEIFRAALASSGATVIPVDSEHNAIFQLIDPMYRDTLEKVTITASGGPFREWASERMASATPEQAVAHPNWSMGAKISVDSATLMNKGLELIEAHYLFSLPPEKLGVLIHPQSVVHCLVSYADGAVLAHLSSPDMRTPISHALAWPRRIASPTLALDLALAKPLTFMAPDLGKFPCLGLAQHCLRTGGRTTTILNAANEIAVQAFLRRRIGFLDIVRVVEETLSADHEPNDPHNDLDAVLAVDGRARAVAEDFCRRLAA
jgi:1-deoxy-D-xylulose-5-phosphate reductoisomerase